MYVGGDTAARRAAPGRPRVARTPLPCLAAGAGPRPWVRPPAPMPCARPACARPVLLDAGRFRRIPGSCVMYICTRAHARAHPKNLVRAETARSGGSSKAMALHAHAVLERMTLCARPRRAKGPHTYTYTYMHAHAHVHEHVHARRRRVQAHAALCYLTSRRYMPRGVSSYQEPRYCWVRDFLLTGTVGFRMCRFSAAGASSSCTRVPGTNSPLGAQNLHP